VRQGMLVSLAARSLCPASGVLRNANYRCSSMSRSCESYSSG
jgi:hypothetical protein